MNMPELTRITFNKEIMYGQACIRGMRIPVSLVLNLLAHEYTLIDVKKISFYLGLLGDFRNFIRSVSNYLKE